MNTKHGHFKNNRVLYQRWLAMLSRCNNPKNRSYEYYGGRGIKVSAEWQDVNKFIEDMKPSFNVGLTLDRIDTNGNYCKENCKWVSYKENENNRRNKKTLSFNGVDATITEWATKLGLKKGTISQRYYVYGWDIGRCLTKGVSSA